MFLDKDMMRVKLEVAGVTYYFSNTELLNAALIVGGSGLIRNANYVIENGRFLKNRSAGDQLPNTILAVGREEINKLFDFMEGK